MSELLGILGDPYRRTKTMYHFKVTGLEGNTARFHDASKVINVVELPNESEHTLEEQYRGQIDNLFRHLQPVSIHRIGIISPKSKVNHIEK